MSRALVVASCALLAAAPARGDVESEHVRAGLAAFERLQYERAVTLLEQARAESLTREEKIATYRTLGFSYVALDRPDEAQRDFERLLTIDPAIELDLRVSPRVRAVFEAARAEVAQHGQHQPPAHRLAELSPAVDPAAPRAGETVALTLVHGGGMARRAELFYRTRGELGFSRVEAPVDDAGRVRLIVPGVAVGAPALEYYAIVLDEAGAAIARAGSLAGPLALPVTPRPVPLHRRRWFWGVMGGVAGVVLIGAITTVAVLSTPSTVIITPR
jgi:tetratricopeptide (TPR) repeat protein